MANPIYMDDRFRAYDNGVAFMKVPYHLGSMAREHWMTTTGPRIAVYEKVVGKGAMVAQYMPNAFELTGNNEIRSAHPRTTEDAFGVALDWWNEALRNAKG